MLGADHSMALVITWRAAGSDDNLGEDATSTELCSILAALRVP